MPLEKDLPDSWFLLNIDNFVVEAFASVEVKSLMERCQPLILFDVSDLEFEEDTILDNYAWEARKQYPYTIKKTSA